MKWVGDKRFVPPFGEFAEGDDVSRLPQEVIDDLTAQGLVSSGVAAAQSEPVVESTAPTSGE